MGQSDAFRKAESEKSATENRRRIQAAENNKKLQELFVEFQKMDKDLRSHSVIFRWGHDKYHLDENCIFISKGFLSFKESNAITIQDGMFVAEGGESIEWDSSRKPKKWELGKTAVEAGETIAKLLIDYDRLPAFGDVTTRLYPDYVPAFRLTAPYVLAIVIVVGVLFWIFR